MTTCSASSSTTPCAPAGASSSPATSTRPALAAAIRRVDVPVVPATAPSASASLATWIAHGRRPLTADSAYADELVAASPELVTSYPPHDARLLAAAISAGAGRSVLDRPVGADPGALPRADGRCRSTAPPTGGSPSVMAETAARARVIAAGRRRWVPDNRWDLVAGEVDDRVGDPDGTVAVVIPYYEQPDSLAADVRRAVDGRARPSASRGDRRRRRVAPSATPTATRVRRPRAHHPPGRSGLPAGGRPQPRCPVVERRCPGLPRRRHASVSGDDPPAGRLARRAPRCAGRRPSPPRRSRRLVAGRRRRRGSAAADRPLVVAPIQRGWRRGTPAPTTSSMPTTGPTGTSSPG